MSLPSSIRCQFPALQQEVNGRPLVYLDSAATSQKPQRVIDAVSNFYETSCANVNRGAYELGRRSTNLYEGARTLLQEFIGAEHSEEIIFTKGCTEAINLAANSWSAEYLEYEDVILVSEMEHHANIVPWQMAAERHGARVIPIPVTFDCEIDLDQFESLLREEPVKMVAVKHICNATGTINPIEQIATMAKEAGSAVMIDGAQGLAHQRVSVKDLPIDFYAMASHKAYGPMGIGALYGKREVLRELPPYQGGGDMIRAVSFEDTTYRKPPGRFEAGTQNPADAAGFAEALRFISEVGVEALHQHETEIRIAAEKMLQDAGADIVGSPKEKAGIISFVLPRIHPHDFSTFSDQLGAAIRTGHHCCMPLMSSLGLPGTARVSLAAYNSIEDLNVLIEAIESARRIFA